MLYKKSHGERHLQEKGTSTGVGGKDCEVIIFQRNLIEKLCTLLPYLNIDHCMPKATKMITLIITKSIANLPSVKNTMIKI